MSLLKYFSVRRKPGWMAILPQGGAVTLAHVVRAANSRPQVCRLDSFAVERGEADALQRLRVARELKSYACTTLMADGDYSVSQLDAPPVPPDERREALRWALKETVSYPLESACIDVLDIPNTGLPSGRPSGVLVVSASEQAVRARVAPFDAAKIRLAAVDIPNAGLPPGRSAVLVVAAAEAAVRARVASFEAAKIRLAAVDIPELAQRNVAALLEDDNRGLAFLRIDEGGMMLTLTFHGELIAVRRGEVTSLQLNGPDAEQRARVKERLVLELQRSLDNFDRQYSHIPISKVVVASYPLVEELVAELGESTYVPIREMDLATVMSFPGIPELRDPQCQAKHLLALGAALRTAGAAQ